jgi:hypothetical protein
MRAGYPSPIGSAVPTQVGGAARVVLCSLSLNQVSRPTGTAGEGGRTVDGVEQAILATALTPGVATRGSYTPAYGHGVVDAQAAVNS